MASPVKGHRFSGAHGQRTINMTHMSIWALILAAIAVPTVPIAFGYFFGSLSVIFASIVIGQSFREEVGQGPLIGAWIALALSSLAMVGYIVYILVNSENYLF